MSSLAKVTARGLSVKQLHALAGALIDQAASCEELLAGKDRKFKYRQTKIEQLTREMAVLKRWWFGKSCEQFDAAQLRLFDETLNAHMASIEIELVQLASKLQALTSPSAPVVVRAAPCGVCPRGYSGRPGPVILADG